MTVLSIIQQHCRIHALSIPSSVVGASDTQTQQLFGILSEVLDDMVQESKFNVTTQEATFVATGAEDQGAMTTLAPNGYHQANFETFYDRTLRRPLYGPLQDNEWAAIKALPNPGPYYKFRIRGDHLLINPVPTAPFSTIAFEYMSSWAVVSSGGVLKAAITADTDTLVFPETIVRKWMMYRWKLIKGLPYQEDRDAAYNLLNNYIAKDKVKRRINVGGPAGMEIRPGVFVPSGSWMQ